MLRCPTRPALALLGALLCLAACTPTARPATVGRAPTATPARVPAGWKVLTTPHFSLAYPPDRTENSYGDARATTYTLYHATVRTSLGATVHTLLSVEVEERGDMSGYCGVAFPDAQRTTLAGLPMKYLLTPPGVVGEPVRLWFFANALQTHYFLQAHDFSASAATKAQDDAILATFRPDDATPWKC